LIRGRGKSFLKRGFAPSLTPDCWIGFDSMLLFPSLDKGQGDLLIRKEKPLFESSVSSLSLKNVR